MIKEGEGWTDFWKWSPFDQGGRSEIWKCSRFDQGWRFDPKKSTIFDHVIFGQSFTEMKIFWSTGLRKFFHKSRIKILKKCADDMQSNEVQSLVLYRASADSKSSWSSTAQSETSFFESPYTSYSSLTRNSKQLFEWMCFDLCCFLSHVNFTRIPLSQVTCCKFQNKFTSCNFAFFCMITPSFEHKWNRTRFVSTGGADLNDIIFSVKIQKFSNMNKFSGLLKISYWLHKQSPFEVSVS